VTLTCMHVITKESVLRFSLNLVRTLCCLRLIQTHYLMRLPSISGCINDHMNYSINSMDNKQHRMNCHVVMITSEESLIPSLLLRILNNQLLNFHRYLFIQLNISVLQITALIMCEWCMKRERDGSFPYQYTFNR
jgi:hypothetical protein